MKFTFSFIAMCLSFTSNAFALPEVSKDELSADMIEVLSISEAPKNEEAPLLEGPAQSLTIVGKGIQNRKTGEVIALACVGESANGSPVKNCDVLQHVYFKNSQSLPVFVGSTLKVANHNIKKTLRTISKDYRHYRWDLKNHDGAAAFCAIGSLVYWFGSISLLEPLGFGKWVNGSIHVSPVVGWSILGGSVLLLAGTGLSQIDFSPLKVWNDRAVTAMADQKGWNWEIPKTVSNRKFRKFYSFVN